VYAVSSLQRIPFALNTNDFHFDTEIIIELLFARLRIKELPIPTYYGDELCHVNGLKYAWDVVKAVVVARSQGMGLFYDRRYDCAPTGSDNRHYQLKLDYESPHTLSLEKVPGGATVLDLGCAGGYVAALLRERNRCHVTGVDRHPPGPGVELDHFVRHDLNDGPPALDLARYDFLLLLDVIEHLASPETFIEELREALKLAPRTKLLVSTGNVGFLINRLMLLIGQFNYGKRGVLDLTHSRLFTFATFRRLFEQAGFRVVESRGIPGPFPLALGHNTLSRALVALNRWLIRASRGLFAYQMFFVVEPLPSLEYLLREAHTHSALKSAALSGEPDATGLPQVATVGGATPRPPSPRTTSPADRPRR
jgi:2-polyprenyl-3-methyl-5-hydroxy-6-metoxy-1,4-benzoquinol methylase